MKKILLFFMALIGFSAFAFVPGEATSTNLNKREAQVDPTSYGFSLPAGWTLELEDSKLYITDGQGNLSFDMEDANGKSFSITEELSAKYVALSATYKSDGQEDIVFQHNRDQYNSYLFNTGSFTVFRDDFDGEGVFVNIFTTGGGGDEFESGFRPLDSDINITCEFYFLIEDLPDDVSPVFSGETAFVTNIDAPLPESTIRSYIYAWDDTDGNVTDRIVLEEDNYTNYSDQVGTFTLKYSVSDLSGNEAYLTVHVLVKDIVAPSFGILEANTTVRVGYKETADLAGFIPNLLVSDNYYIPGDIDVEITADNYTANKGSIGNYIVTYTATDPSGNSSSKNITYQVYDNVIPVISGPLTLTIPISEPMTQAQLLALYTANDEISGNITSSLEVVENTYTGNETVKGSYTFRVKATDAAGNVEYRSTTLYVSDDLPPVFYVKDGYFISVEQSIELTLEDIIEILVITGQITSPESFTFSYDYNEYQDNYSTPGIYAMGVRATRNDNQDASLFNLAVQVIGEEEPGPNPDPEEPGEEKPWYEVAWDGFTESLQEYWYFYVMGLLSLVLVIAVLVKIFKK